MPSLRFLFFFVLFLFAFIQAAKLFGLDKLPIGCVRLKSHNYYAKTIPGETYHGAPCQIHTQNEPKQITEKKHTCHCVCVSSRTTTTRRPFPARLSWCAQQKQKQHKEKNQDARVSEKKWTGVCVRLKSHNYYAKTIPGETYHGTLSTQNKQQQQQHQQQQQ